MVDDARMDEYHRRFSGVAGTTDVLTFCGSDGPDEAGGMAVDLIVCADEAHRRAKEFGHAPEREVLLYAVHGILHCLGHDDHDPAAYERMHAEEDSILEAAGVGATFRPRQPGDGADLVSERTDA
jgi:probable rRNA maturation factor